VTLNCYSTGTVTGDDHFGGLVGNNDDSEIRNSFWDIESSEQLISAGGTDRTTAEMQVQSTFTDVGWDFEGEPANGTYDLWWIDEGQDYPRLWWEPSSSD
jgi:hypothetical protein